MENKDNLKRENENLKKQIANDYIAKKEIMKYVFSELVKLKILKPSQDPFNSTKNLLENLSKFDKIISWCLENKIFDLSKVNDYLYTFCGTIL